MVKLIQLFNVQSTSALTGRNIKLYGIVGIWKVTSIPCGVCQLADVHYEFWIDNFGERLT